MITDQIVNEIYWAPSFDHGYTYGSRITISDMDVVTLSNPLIAFGKSLMTWTTAMNWQSSKEVSQLPILQFGQKYQITVLADFEPANSVIVRLTFFDLQGEEIKQLNLVDQVSEFTCPPDTVDYQLELINAGCVGLTFRRVEIGPAELPLEANDDLWLQEPINDQEDNQLKPINLLVIGGGKRMKRTYRQLGPLAGNLPVQSLLVAWQSRDDVSQHLEDLLLSNHVDNVHLISSEPRFDRAVVN
ncbi:accessory Sec system protein Asp3, partial [Bartonella sp. CL63NXGY]|uniref:accessory Sec system protein Asp3 n=1 Tax=Bartonella sp. CL63NXGY TaxID=3243538 RepID=UPI0035D0B1A1